MSSSTFSHLPWAGSVSSTCAGLCVSHTLAADWSAFFQEADGPMEWRSQTENYVANPCVFVGIDQISLTKFRLIVDEFSEMQDMLGDMMMYNVYIYIYKCIFAGVKHECSTMLYSPLRFRSPATFGLCPLVVAPVFAGEARDCGAQVAHSLCCLDSILILFKVSHGFFQDFCFRWLMNRIKTLSLNLSGFWWT